MFGLLLSFSAKTKTALTQLLLLCCLSACASTPQSDRLLSGQAAPLPEQYELSQVPFFSQDALQCGPASLAMLLNYEPQQKLTPAQLKAEVFTPGLQGSLGIDLISASRRHGALAYVIKPDLDILLREVTAGHPVLILQNLAFNWYPFWHYAVVIGYDLPKQEILLRSGKYARLRMPLRVFERTWARGGRWALLVLPPDVLPASADEAPFLRAALGLEKARQFQAAAQAYATAHKRWPDSEGAALGLGNSQYALQDLEAAAQAFTAGLVSHPASAALHNNLAQTLLDLKRPEAALSHARKAVALDGENPAFQDTLQAAQAAKP